MIEIEEQTIGGERFAVLNILDNGFIPTGFVQSEYRILDGDSEGVGLAISVCDQDVAKNGSYSPHSLDKAETKQLIDFLQGCYEQM